MLPGPLHANQASVKEVLNTLAADGACWLTGLDASTPDQMLEWAERLGSWDLGIAEELLGPRIMHLRYDPEKVQLASQPAYFTSDEFPLHTDVSYVPNPPGLMLMHCVRPDPAGGGQVLLADCDAAQKLLHDEVVATLQQPDFRFLYPPACPAGASAPAAILEQGRWRFKFACMEFAAVNAPAVNAFHRALLAVCETVMLQAGDLLVVDNQRMAHGRTAFGESGTAANNLQAGRHIMRCYVNASA
jgi:hypothetical protein